MTEEQFEELLDLERGNAMALDRIADASEKITLALEKIAKLIELG